MKNLFLAILLIFVTFAHANVDESIKTHADACMSETGAAKDEVMKLKNHDFSSDDPKTKCFAKCFCVKAGLCDSNLNMVVAKVEDHIPPEQKHKVEDATKKCDTTTGADPCDTVYSKFRCFFKELQ
uniref:CSON008395 protein n=1 Tax=Culicoides sonorensis TaxID=179676 RepID=A0A336N7Q2_CULSO